MLDRCRRKLPSENGAVRNRVTLERGDMRDFRYDVPFQLVTIPFRPFQHLDSVAEQLACLASIHRALAEGGRLILDVFNPSLTAIVDETRLQEVSSGATPSPCPMDASSSGPSGSPAATMRSKLCSST